MVRVIRNHRQYVHLNIWDDYGFNFLFTPVYGSSQAKNRMELWSELSIIAPNVNDPWIVGGDFNAILYKEEKCGGARQAIGCKKFGAWMKDCAMEDMGFVGSKFTWKGGRFMKDWIGLFVIKAGGIGYKSFKSLIFHVYNLSLSYFVGL